MYLSTKQTAAGGCTRVSLPRPSGTLSREFWPRLRIALGGYMGSKLPAPFSSLLSPILLDYLLFPIIRGLYT